MNEISVNEKTMSSSQLGELLNYEKKEVNRKILAMFKPEIDGGKITPSFYKVVALILYIIDNT